MPNILKIKIPLIVTADGKWAASGSHFDKEPDWQDVDERCDFQNPTISPRRYLVETAVEIPETLTVSGVAMPADD